MLAIAGLSNKDGIEGFSVTIILDRDSGGNHKFGMMYHILAGWQTADLGSTTISVDGSRWYSILLLVHNGANATEDSIQWWVDYGNPLEGAYTNEGSTTGKTLDRPTNAIFFGDFETADSHSLLLTGIRVADNAMPLECLR